MKDRVAVCVVIVLAIFAERARAESGDNEACPGKSLEADDVRETYDADGRLVRQLRLLGGRLVEQVTIAYGGGGHPTERVESTSGHTRVARTTWNDDYPLEGECAVDDAIVARIVYRYESGRLVEKEERENGRIARTTRLSYDDAGRWIMSEVRGPASELVSRTEALRPFPKTPIHLVASAGGTYQSDTDLIDVIAGLGIHRKPAVEQYGGDPLEVALQGNLNFHRAKGVTSTDQTTARLGVDYNFILPRITLFTFTAMDRNLPANLKLNLEEGFLGIKVDIVPRTAWQLDASFAPVWNFRSILAPIPFGPPGTTTDESTSTFRGSFRLRSAYRSGGYMLADTIEFLPLFFGDTTVPDSGVWDRSIFRNTATLKIDLSKRFAFEQDVKYTRDLSMRAQATCPDSSNPLCRGYAIATLSTLSLTLDLGL